MAYIAKQDFIDDLGLEKLIQLSDPNGTGEVDDAYLEKAIGYAEGKFDSYILTRYSSPIPITEIVKATCLVFAVYKLYANNLSLEEGKYKIEKDKHDGAIKWLETVAKGIANLPGAQLIQSPSVDSSADLSNPGSYSVPSNTSW